MEKENEGGHNWMNPTKPFCCAAASEAAFKRPGRREVTVTLAATAQSIMAAPVEGFLFFFFLNKTTK